jgi:hypothetical protein
VDTSVPIIKFKYASTLEADIGWAPQQGDVVYNSDKQYFIEA